jgi:hypothetical protein
VRIGSRDSSPTLLNFVVAPLDQRKCTHSIAKCP